MRIALTVNGRPVEAEVAPRTSLADFVREHLRLTGTHLGCEHGICGACTVEVDGEIARSCITYAVACDGAKVRTIEGFDDDPLMAKLRRAFTEAHALQCGYCTPGMLVAARDLVRRKGGLSRQEIRHDMSGNLCRCTGYVGIVDAIARVMAEEGAERGQTPGGIVSDTTSGRGQGSDPMPRWLGPAPGPIAATAAEHGVRPAGSDPAGDIHHRFDDLDVPGAPAQHAAEGVLHLGAHGHWGAQEAIHGRHQHAGRTDAALGGAVDEERAAQPLRQPVRPRTFDRVDVGAFRLGRGDQAGAGLAAVDEHRAGAAVAGVAADLGADELKAVAQRTGEAGEWIGGDGGSLAVEGEPYGGCGGGQTPRLQRRG